MAKSINDFREWLVMTEMDGHVPRIDALKYLEDCPLEEWVIGARVICSSEGLPVIYISYLLEKLISLETPGGWRRIFDSTWRADFLRLREMAVQK